MSASQPRLARSGQSRAVEALGFVVIFPRQFSAKPLVSAKPLAGKHTCSFRFDIQNPAPMRRPSFDALRSLRLQ
jgi:hypothetical protein